MWAPGRDGCAFRPTINRRISAKPAEQCLGVVNAVPIHGAEKSGLRNLADERVVACHQSLAGGATAKVFCRQPVAIGKFACKHFVALFQQVIACKNLHFLPVVKVKFILAVKKAVETVPVERNFVPGKANELFQLVGLLLEQLIPGEVLAFHQERENLVLEILRHK